ncbi:MAG: cytochrome c biogenesis protein CcsA [Betaproteobacteria bacterium]|nr:cytochrome c biogenesis protein CcsA [Betaproteobacteria bacterium]
MRPILLHLHLIPAALYAVLGLYFWRARSANPAASGKPVSSMARFERVLLVLALLVHSFALYAEIFPKGEMRFGPSIAFSLAVWLSICFYWVETLYNRLDGLRVIVLPAGVLACLLVVFFPYSKALPNDNIASPIFCVHLIIAMLACSLFMLALLHAMLMAMATKQLHHAHLSKALANLPPLLTMEALLFRLIGTAFMLLTLTLLTGVILFGTAFPFDYKSVKSVFATISWLLFGILLIGRHFRGWRGRVALRWTLAGFVALFITVMLAIGSRFVIEVLLHR